MKTTTKTKTKPTKRTNVSKKSTKASANQQKQPEVTKAPVNKAKLGLKEQVKAGVTSAKDAMYQLSLKGKQAIESSTYQWLMRMAARQH